MSIAHSSGNTSVTGSVSVTTSSAFATPSAATQSVINVYIAGTGNIDVYTVPAGKRFMLYGISAYNATRITFFKNDGSTQVAHIRTEADGNGALFTSPIPIWTYAAGEVVKFNSNSAAYIGNMWGILETV